MGTTRASVAHPRSVSAPGSHDEQRFLWRLGEAEHQLPRQHCRHLDFADSRPPRRRDRSRPGPQLVVHGAIDPRRDLRPRRQRHRHRSTSARPPSRSDMEIDGATTTAAFQPAHLAAARGAPSRAPARWRSATPDGPQLHPYIMRRRGASQVRAIDALGQRPSASVDAVALAESLARAVSAAFAPLVHLVAHPDDVVADGLVRRAVDELARARGKTSRDRLARPRSWRPGCR